MEERYEDDDYQDYRCCGCCFEWLHLTDERELRRYEFDGEALKEFRSKCTAIGADILPRRNLESRGGYRNRY